MWSRMTVRFSLVIAAAAAAGPGLCRGEEFHSYPQFRYLGGLPGNGYAVDRRGDIGFQGAMSQCIPVGYTPSAGAWAIGMSSGLIRGKNEFWFTGRDVNGMTVSAMGFGARRHGICLSYPAVDQWPGRMVSVQAQVLGESRARPAVSVGVLDLLNEDEAVVNLRYGPGARSYYVAATKRLGEKKRPVHATLGWGSGRFHDAPFVGASYDVARRVKVLAEYDGYQFNAGGAWDVVGWREHTLILSVGAASLNRPVVTVTYAH
jgi:hypothetical protein